MSERNESVRLPRGLASSGEQDAFLRRAIERLELDVTHTGGFTQREWHWVACYLHVVDRDDDAMRFLEEAVPFREASRKDHCLAQLHYLYSQHGDEAGLARTREEFGRHAEDRARYVPLDPEDLRSDEELQHDDPTGELRTRLDELVFQLHVRLLVEMGEIATSRSELEQRLASNLARLRALAAGSA